MNLTILLIFGVLLSIAFHFVGVYAGAKKTVWFVIVLIWAAVINVSMSEIKPNGYKDIKSIEGKYADVDALIKKSMPKISVYEMLEIKKRFDEEESKK